MKDWMKIMKAKCVCLLLALVLSVFGAAAMPEPSMAAESSQERGVSHAIIESLTGDVYAEPSKWRELCLSTFFTDGWDEPWASPPAGGGGAPRQGWLNAYDGVFYRLGIASYGYANDFGDNGHQQTGLLQLYLPFSRRFEFRTDIPFVVSNRGPIGNSYHTGFGDFAITPRVILSETREVTQSLNVSFRTPTGSTSNFNGVAAVTPSYEIWTNWWKGLVVRGGIGFFTPYGNQSLDEAGARASFLGNVAVGYYFTPHDLTPIGDLVGYLSVNVGQTIDDRGPSRNTTSLTPGFRTHLGRNWYLLGAVEVPVTNPEPFDYQVLAGLMKVF
jgi:hypothetical protein